MALTKERLQQLSREAFDIASEHGFHDEEKPIELLLSLIMSEVAEIIEADRKGRHALYNESDNVPYDDEEFKTFYNENIKGSIEEEFADVAIRLMDYAYTYFGEDMDWDLINKDYYVRVRAEGEPIYFVAWYFIKNILDFDMESIATSMRHIINWSRDINMDLEKHIELKSRFNSLRTFMHGGKKY